MMRGLLLLLRQQWLMWRNAWRPESRQRSRMIGALVTIPLFMGGLFAASLYFLRESGLVEMLALADIFAGAGSSARALTVEALSLSTTTTFLMISLGALDQAFESYFLAPDLPLLLTAPISRQAVFCLRFLMNMRWDATMILVTAIPVWLAFAVWLHAPAVFYLVLLIGWMLLLVFVSGLGVILAMILARFVTHSRVRQILISFMLSVGLLVVVLIQGFVAGVWSREGVQALLGVRVLSRQVWLPSVWLSKGLAGLMMGDASSWPWLGALAVTAMLSFGIAFWAAMRAYRRGWSLVQTAERVEPSRARRRPQLISHSASWALVQKDLRLFFRQPMQWYQAVLGTIAVVMVLVNFVGEYREDTSAFMLSLVMGYVGASTFAMNLSLRGIAKEGLSWWIVQASPLEDRDILRAKFGTAAIPTAIYACLSLIGMGALLRLPWWATAVSVPILLALIVAMISVDLAVGLWRTDFGRVAQTRNADVTAVLVSQLLNYLLLSPGLLLLSLPPLFERFGLRLELGSMIAFSTIFYPMSAVATLLSRKYSLRALSALRLSEDAPGIGMLGLRRASRPRGQRGVA